MPQTLRVNTTFGVAISRPGAMGEPVVATYIAFMEEDTVPVIEALEIRNMPKIWHLGDLAAISRSGPAVLKVEALTTAGISFSYASYNTGAAKIPAKQGEIRYGHDGTVLHLNLLTNRELLYMYAADLHHRTDLNDNEVNRIAHVCCGTASWENRIEHGQMHRMRLLLT